jgi:hypothetical protein
MHGNAMGFERCDWAIRLPFVSFSFYEFVAKESSALERGPNHE